MMKGGITMMNNFFNELEAKMAAWIEKRNTHESIKEIVAKENGWDSEAMNAWKAEMEEIKAEQPYTQGECRAFRVWKYGGGTDTDIILDDYVWDDEVHDFIHALRSAGIETITIIDSSTALMRTMHGFAAEGCVMIGLCTIPHPTFRDETKPGVKFKIG